MKRRSADRRMLAVLCGGSFLAVVDTTIVTIALPSIQRDLGFSAAGVQWVLNGYTVVFGGLLLLFGRIGDLYGRRRSFLLGAAGFAAASLLAAAAWRPEVLIAGRLLQGLAAAALVPASLALLTAAYRPPARTRALGIYGAMSSIGFVVGMLGGGLITEWWGWRWVLAVNVPVALWMFISGRRYVIEDRPRPTGRRLDLAGGLTVTGGAALVIYAVGAAAEPEAPVAVWPAAVIGLLLLVCFGLIQRRHTDPLTPREVITDRRVLLANATIAAESMIGTAWLYVLTLHFQYVLGQGPLVTGLFFAPMTLASLVAAFAAGRLAARWGLRRTAIAGLLMLTGGVGVMIAGVADPSSITGLIIGTMIGEAGFVLAAVALIATATTAVADAHGGLAAGLVNTATQLGNALGLAVVAAVVGLTLARAEAPTAAAHAAALPWGMVACAGFCVLALLLMIFGVRPGDPPPTGPK